MHAGIEALAELDAPVISVVRGAAAGGGMSIAIAADLVLAAESAHFTVAYTAIGFSMDGGASWTLPRLVGMRKAMELALLNERLTRGARRTSSGSSPGSSPTTSSTRRPSSSRAARPAARSARTARSSGCCASPRRAPFSQQLEDEAHTIAGLSAAPDGREGVLAFLDKRAPHFGEP